MDSMNNDDCSDDIYEYPFLICSRCNHDLNHPAYRIYKHSDLGTPLCILCNDYVTEVEFSKTNNNDNETLDSDNEICTWCKDSNCCEFYICGDGTKCSNLFCKDCIENYPNNQLKEEIDNNEEWICLKCNDSKKFLQPYYNAISIFNKSSWYYQNLDAICTEINLNDIQISNILILLKALLEEEQDTISRLSMKNRSYQYQIILHELKQKNDSNHDDIKRMAADELIIYTSQWQRHLDLISRQITDLDEVLERNGYDSNSLIKETIKIQNDEEVNDEFLETESEELMQIDNIVKENIQKDDDETNDNVHGYVEDVLGCNEDCDEYKKIQLRLTKLNNIVNKDLELYEFINNPDKPDISDDIFPSDFKYLFPMIVLKALYYFGMKSDKGKALISRYKVSEFPHVLLIMRYIDQNISKNSIQWPTMKHLHPAVIKVLRLTDRPSDIELLGNYYNLNEMDAIDDMGDIKEVYNLYQTSGLEHKKKFRIGNDFEKIVNNDQVEVRFSMSELLDADETERNSECLSIKQKNQIITGSFAENDDLQRHSDSLFSNKRNSKRKLNDKSSSIKNSERLSNSRYKSKIIKDIGEKSKSSDADDDCHSNDFTEDDLLDSDLIKFGNNKNGVLTVIPDKKDTFILPTESPLYIQSIKNKKGNESSDKSLKVTSQICSSDSRGEKMAVEIIDLLDSDDDFMENKPPKKSKCNSNFFVQNTVTANKGDNLDRLLSTFDRKEVLRKKVNELFPKLDPLDDDSNYLVLNKKRISKGDEPIYLMQHFQNKLKQHQKDGLQFIWNNVIDEIDTGPNTKKRGGGCILAHCMGLGKTLTIIAFTVTVLTSPVLHNFKFDPTPPIAKTKSATSKSPTKDKNQGEMENFFSPMQSSETPTNTQPRNYFFTVLIITPVNTLTNWVNEFNNWCPDEVYKTRRNSYINVTLLSADDTKMEDRVRKMKKWHQDGGVLVMGYDMFRNLADCGKKDIEKNTSKNLNAKYFTEINKYLLEPGADIVICDEAHTIKEKKSKITEILSKIATKRRVALTGSPLQNNLEEYYQMVSWVRPRFLGTLTNFKKSYVNIIAAGEHKEAQHSEVIAMRKRAYMLHKKLKPLVDRKDLTELEKSLPPKREFSVLIRMSEFQSFMYKTFLSKLIEANKGGSGQLIFTAFQALLRVWNHPAIAIVNSIQKSNKETKNKTKSKQVISMKVLEKEIEPIVDFYYSQDNEFLQKISENVLKLEANLAEEKSSLKVGNAIIDLVDDSDNDDEFEYDNENYNVADETQVDVEDDVVMQLNEDKENFNDLSNQNLNDNSTTCYDTAMKSDLSNEDLGSLTTLIESEPYICDENWWKLKERSQDTPSFEHGEFIKLSNKLFIFLSILGISINAGDKVLVFTQSVMTLELLECVLKSERWGEVISIKSECSTCKFSQWKENYHYLRIDGTTSDRQDMIDKFNKTEHIKLFMLSTKAGNMGINLQSANRVIIFDSSWNPAHDLQAIYRAYRYGQTKNVFVYRLLAAGTMEEKIYKKQINKMTRSARIIDAQMPDNHFTMEEKAELLKFTEYKDADFDKIKDSLSREPRDNVLLNIIKTSQSYLHAIDDQTALLEDKDELKLTEVELKEADEELAKEENDLKTERQLIPTPPILIPIQTEQEKNDTILYEALSVKDKLFVTSYVNAGLTREAAFDKLREQQGNKN